MVSNSLVFCVVFFAVILVEECCALKRGDVGTCVGKVSTMSKKQVSYWITGRCKNAPHKVCRARRWKTVPTVKWTNGTICCEGWQHDAELDACRPVCSLGCRGGHCLAPERCHCEPPATLHPVTRNLCLPPPLCPQACTNANCTRKHLDTQEGTCECVNNTRRYNETHCAFCGPGFEIEPDLSCTPICDTPCVNGQCVAPNTCGCNDGFRLTDGVCEPHCELCVNSTCVGPNTCKCLDGFVAVNSTHCACECENGDCVSGGCVCHERYRQVDGVCEPVCGSCVNSVCVRPGECLCYEGHARRDAAVCCRPECGTSCDDDGECPMVACAPRTRTVIPNCKPSPHRRCTQFVTQQKMSCCKGWKYIAKEDRCEPTCKSGCLNADCIAPETCACWPGYAEHNDTACVSHCDTPCNNGVCTSPNHCTCDPHHEPDPDDPFNCRPTCEQKCENASCASPNKCECDPGYEPVNSWQCKPVCDDCQHGRCVAPNNCACDDGYDKVDGRCAPACDQPCANGQCTGPNVCTCKEGFRLDATNEFVCVPICEPICEHGKCVSPNVCSCDEGYEKENERKCKPVCENCQNGDCVAPNSCDCHMGYENRDGTCTPVCEQPCINGHCAKPNECSCKDGYQLDVHNKFNCIPVCQPGCVNGRCVSPDVCFCDAGYKFGTENKWKCNPVCDNCENGVCVAPDVCSCDEGYTLAGGRCVPVCKSCLNGQCVKPNQCDCFRGYELNMATSQCDPVCELGCVNAKCDKPNHCKCFDGYEKSSKPYVCQPVCKNCTNGKCVAPHTCECDPGYYLNKGQCTPVCSGGCFNGKCTSPNTCTCFDGYVKRSEGDNVCHKSCDSDCENGVCNEGVCQCNTGFVMQNNTCQPLQAVDCDSCESNCTTDGYCSCSNGTPCFTKPSSEEIKHPTNLAGLEWSWMLGGALGLLLITLLLVVMQRIWVRRRRDEKAIEKSNGVGSVVNQIVVPDSLITSRIPEDEESDARTPLNLYSDHTQAQTQAQDSLLGAKLRIEDEPL